MATSRVRLTQEARQPFSTLITTGRAAAATRLPARIFRKADACAGSRGWTAAEIAVAVDTSASPVPRGRQACVAPGWEVALSRQRPTGRQSRQRDGAQAAQLIAFAGRAPPAGRARWTLR
jgi:hypothetical protein